MEPKYSIGEEIANTFTHSLGALMSIYGIMMLVASSKNVMQSTSAAIFGIALFLLFQSSACYHAITNETLKRFFRKIDHSAIYILIAGTYTPALLLTVKFPLNIVMLAMIWGVTIAGIVFSWRTVKSKSLSTGLYLFMGWMAVIFAHSVWMASHLTFWLMLAGGIFYTFGCVFYLMHFRYMHSIWHLFVIAGAFTHYFAVMELLKALS